MKTVVIIFSALTLIVFLGSFSRYIGKNFIYRNEYIRPDDWNAYTSSSGRYSLSYPNTWFLIDCSNGEIALAKHRVEKCHLPLDAPQGYIDALHMQVFLPHRSKLVTKSDIKSDHMRKWNSINWDLRDYFYPDIVFNLRKFDVIAGNRIPVDITSSHTNAVMNDQIMIGYFEKAEYKEQYEQVFTSVRFLE